MLAVLSGKRKVSEENLAGKSTLSRLELSVLLHRAAQPRRRLTRRQVRSRSSAGEAAHPKGETCRAMEC